MFKQLTDSTKAFTFYGIAFALAVAVVPLSTILGEGANFVTMFTPLISVLLMLLVVTRDGYSKAGWASLGLHRAGIRGWGNKRDEAIIEMLLGTGLRISELLALRVGDVSLEERSGEVTVRYGKGGVYRTVPLTSVVRKAVRDYLETQPELKPDDLLWVGERGVLTDRGSVLYLLKKYAFQARLDERLISPHVLRHTFATRYLSANPDDLRGLAAILGHSNLNTVMIYTTPTSAELTSRMEKAELTNPYTQGTSTFIPEN